MIKSQIIVTSLVIGVKQTVWTKSNMIQSPMTRFFVSEPPSPQFTGGKLEQRAFPSVDTSIRDSPNCCWQRRLPVSSVSALSCSEQEEGLPYWPLPAPLKYLRKRDGVPVSSIVSWAVPALRLQSTWNTAAWRRTEQNRSTNSALFGPFRLAQRERMSTRLCQILVKHI